MKKRNDESNKNRSNGKHRMLNKATALGTGALVLAGGTIGAKEVVSLDHQIDGLKKQVASVDAQANADREAFEKKLNEIQNRPDRSGTVTRSAEKTSDKDFALQQAADYTRGLRLGLENSTENPYVPMMILNGTVSLKPEYHNGDGSAEAPDIKNPILLSASVGNSYDQTNFLDGAWLGMQSYDSDGLPTIEAFQFNTDTLEFTVDEKADSPILSVGVYATEVHGTQAGYMLIAFDPLGNKVLESGETIVSPGLPQEAR